MSAQKKKTELLSVLCKRRNSARRASSLGASRHRRRKELFEFWERRKSPLRDLYWVAEYPEVLSKRLLEQKDSQEASIFSI
jgi:hypothetical protein